MAKDDPLPMAPWSRAREELARRSSLGWRRAWSRRRQRGRHRFHEWIDVQQGSVVVRKLGSSGEKADPIRIEVAGRTGEVDPKIGGSVVVRAKLADRADGHRGKG